MNPTRTFSIIIPTLNEAAWIETTVEWVKKFAPAGEIIIVDGGSTDDTVPLAHRAGVRVVESGRGRGIQRNSGAKQASGDLLLFLHADTLLPVGGLELVSNLFDDQAVEIGTFRLAFDENSWVLRFYAAFTRLDSVFTRFGDQCIVVRRTFFEELGGFPDWPLFEDVHLLRLARRRTRVISFPATVTTSARRFTRKGMIRTQLINGWLMMQYLCGVSPAKLAAEYAVEI